jgi:anthranilate synthase component 1
MTIADVPDCLPRFEDFSAALAEARHQLVWTRIVADTETPISAMLKP